MIATGVMLGYAIQMFVVIQIIFSKISASSKFAQKHPTLSELMLRTLMVLVTFTIAELVPNLGLLLTLIGSVGCAVLAFVFPALSELIILNSEKNGIRLSIWIKNIIILLIAFTGFIFGGSLSLKQIIEEIVHKFSSK